VSADVEKRMVETPGTFHFDARRRGPSAPGPGSFRTMPVDYARVADEIGKIEPWLRQWAGSERDLKRAESARARLVG